MTTSNYLLCFASAILGMCIYVFVVKIPSALERAKVANVPITIGQYFKHDAVALIGSLASILLALLCADEILHLYPQMKGLLKIIYGFIGFTNSTLIIAALGRVQRMINEVVDFKTDKADGKLNTGNNETGNGSTGGFAAQPGTQ